MSNGTLDVIVPVVRDLLTARRCIQHVLASSNATRCDVMIISNACGGLNPQFSKGDIMVIEDHIGLFMDNPLRGPTDDRLGIRTRRQRTSGSAPIRSRKWSSTRSRCRMWW